MLYRIAEHILRVELQNTAATRAVLSSYEPFVIEDNEAKALCTVTVDDTLKAYPKTELRLIKDVDTGNGPIAVYRHTVNGEDVGYQFVIRDIYGNSCSLLQADNDFSNCQCALRGSETMISFGLNNALMLSYAFSTGRLGTLLVHASMVRRSGKAYAFIAVSGTGKSTQTANWLKVFPDCDLMNDDNPVFRVVDGKVTAYGSPWSGKTPCYRNVSAPLAGIAKIVRDKENFLVPMMPVEAFTEMMTSVSMMRWDKDLIRHINQTISQIVENVPMYNLHCLPDEDSARVASKGMEA